MKISRNDPFDLHLCLRGLGNQLTYMHNDIFDFMYNRTVKPGRITYMNALEDLKENRTYDYSQFENSRNHCVKLCFRIDLVIRKYKLELCTRWGIDEVADLQDDLIMEQAKRFSPRLLRFKKSKNFIKVEIFYARVLTGFVDCLHSYLCAITLRNYKIPIEREEQIELCDQYDLRLINENEDSVRFLNELIGDMIEDIEEYDDDVEATVRGWGGWDAIIWG